MIPGAFEYHRPASLSEAAGLLSRLGEDAQLLAGGHSLIPMMKLRLATPEHLIDLQNVPELKGVRSEAGVLVIGAMVTQADLIASDTVRNLCPILRQAALQIADPQVRNLGTVGGNVANGDPGNDMPCLMQTLNATFVLTGVSGAREVAAREFYRAALETAREPGEILTRIRVPIPPMGHRFAYEKQKRKIGDYATAAAAVVLSMNGAACASAAIGLTNLSDTPVFAVAAGQALVGTTLDAAAIDAAAKAAAAAVQPVADNRGPVEFKRHLAAVVTRRAIERAAGKR